MPSPALLMGIETVETYNSEAGPEGFAMIANLKSDMATLATGIG